MCVRGALQMCLLHDVSPATWQNSRRFMAKRTFTVDTVALDPSAISVRGSCAPLEQRHVVSLWLCVAMGTRMKQRALSAKCSRSMPRGTRSRMQRKTEPSVPSCGGQGSSVATRRWSRSPGRHSLLRDSATDATAPVRKCFFPTVTASVPCIQLFRPRVQISLSSGAPAEPRFAAVALSFCGGTATTTLSAGDIAQP